MLSFVKKYNSLSVRPIVILLTRVLFSQNCGGMQKDMARRAENKKKKGSS
jgi:hypothetical protein